MKIVLKNGTELPVNSVNLLSEKQLQISFSGVTDYSALRLKATIAAMKEVKVYAGTSFTEAYENFTKFVSPSSIAEAAGGTIDVTMIFEKEDVLSQRLSQLEDDSLTSLLAITELYEMLLTLQGV